MSSQGARQIKSIVGGNIRTARKAKKLTQVQLAAALNMDPIAVSRWERGSNMPDAVATVPRIAEALGVEIAWLYTDHERRAA